MEHLSVDIETYSSVDIRKAGAFKYARSRDFEILLFAYSIDFGEVEVVDLTCGGRIPDEIAAALADESVIKHAYNAAFEWYCLNQAGYYTPITSWRCTMFHAMYLGFPAGLAATGAALGLDAESLKDRTGKALINYFCKPCKQTKSNSNRTRNKPQHARDKWELFIEYNRQDVVAEVAIYKALVAFAVPHREQKLWEYDTLMNAYGVRVDQVLVDKVLAIDSYNREAMVAEARSLTGLANPNSSAQLVTWLGSQGISVDNLRKETVTQLLASDISENVRRVLEVRRELAKTSIKKYDAMAACACDDGRMRGLLQVYGANRTGRWAGRLVQVQNLPRNYINTLDLAREWARKGNGKALAFVYGNVSDTLAQLVRTAFIPSEGRKFVVADFSAIEARVIAWLAEEQWVMDVFATHGKIYEATASQMFDVPIERIKKGNPEYSLRQKGKVATLALGYQGGAPALVAMGALKMGLPEEELPDIVRRWRNANPNIVALWRRVEQAAIATMTDGTTHDIGRGVTISRQTNLRTGLDFLTVGLPSGRSLYYVKPFLKENQFGKQAIHYMDMNQESRKWAVNSTYGGKLTENIVQAIARDCLAETMLRLDQRYHLDPVVMHIHDEVVMDARPEVTVEEICDLMAEPIDWAPGLVLKAAGFESNYYMKD